MSTPEHDLFRQSLRSMAILVGALVLFVGTLSTAAVVITSKAVGGSAATPAATEAPSKDASGKKPLSI